MLPPPVISLLRCPVTRQALRPATDEEKKAAGLPETEEALITLDGSRLYRAVNDMPVLLPSTEVVTSG